jgi:hypothetical protein
VSWPCAKISCFCGLVTSLDVQVMHHLARDHGVEVHNTCGPCGPWLGCSTEKDTIQTKENDEHLDNHHDSLPTFNTITGKFITSNSSCKSLPRTLSNRSSMFKIWVQADNHKPFLLPRILSHNVRHFHILGRPWVDVRLPVSLQDLSSQHDATRLGYSCVPAMALDFERSVGLHGTFAVHTPSMNANCNEAEH